MCMCMLVWGTCCSSSGWNWEGEGSHQTGLHVGGNSGSQVSGCGQANYSSLRDFVSRGLLLSMFYVYHILCSAPPIRREG